MNLYAYVRNDPLNNSDPTGKIKISVGLEGEVTAGLGLGAGVDVQVSFPLPFIDPEAEYDVGWSAYGSLRSGVMAGGGLVGSVEMGSVADTPIAGLEFDAIAGNELIQAGTSTPVEFRDGQMVEADPMGGRVSTEVRTRARAGPSTGGFSEGLTRRLSGSAQRIARNVQDLLTPDEPPPDRQDEPTMIRSPTLPHWQLEFSRSNRPVGLVATGRFSSVIGVLFPIAPCGLTSL